MNSSPNLALSSPNLVRDRQERLVSDAHDLPFVDDLSKLAPEYLQALQCKASEPREKKRIPAELMQVVLLDLLCEQFVTISCLALLVERDPETIRGQYLAAMVKSSKVEIAFPKTPNDPRQAYTKAMLVLTEHGPRNE